MKEIKLSQFGKNKGKYIALVDNEDYNMLMRYKWHAHKNRYNMYAEASVYGKEGRESTLKMTSLLVNIPKGMTVDHIDRDTLNNQKSNLRVCSYSQNSSNRTRMNGKSYTSKYKGIHFHKHMKKYTGYVCVNHKREYIGYFDDEIKAVNARDLLAMKLHGEFAYLNFK